MDDNKPSPHGTGWIVPEPLTRTPQESTDLQLGRFTWCQMAQLISRERPPCLLMGQARHWWRPIKLCTVWEEQPGGILGISMTPFQSCIPPSFCLHVGPNGLSSAWLILIFQYIITNDCQNNPLDHWAVNLIWSPGSHLVIVLILMTK